MTIKYRVREASRNDAHGLARLRWDYRVADHENQARDEFIDECEAWLISALSSKRWTIAVASSQDDSLCGCMYLQSVDKVPNPGDFNRAWGYVTNSYVAPERRGCGIGRSLLNLVVDMARARALEFLIVWTGEEAISLYERAGFRPASRVHDRADDSPPLELEL